MSIESHNFNNQSIIEKIRDNAYDSIEHAKKNAITESRLIELEEKLTEYKEVFFSTGKRILDIISKENEIEKEILQSSVLAYNLIEFKEILEQISTTYGLSKEWVIDTLAHENAHANVAEETEHIFIGYAIIFIKDELGQLSDIQPLALSKPDLSWGPKIALIKENEALRAPETYGNKLSDSDLASIETNNRRLENM